MTRPPTNDANGRDVDANRRDVDANGRPPPRARWGGACACEGRWGEPRPRTATARCRRRRPPRVIPPQLKFADGNRPSRAERGDAPSGPQALRYRRGLNDSTERLSATKAARSAATVKSAITPAARFFAAAAPSPDVLRL